MWTKSRFEKDIDREWCDIKAIDDVLGKACKLIDEFKMSVKKREDELKFENKRILAGSVIAKSKKSVVDAMTETAIRREEISKILGEEDSKIKGA